MQNYSKDDIIPREGRRSRTNTWNSYNDSSSSIGSRHSSFHHHSHGSHHGATPPIMTRINSLDGSSMRIRTESMGSDSRVTGVSPPMQIISHSSMNPSLSFNSPLCSTTDSASSSYSVDYENNNNNSNGHRFLTDYHDEEDESYVPWNPADDHQAHPPTSTSNNSLLTLQFQRDRGGRADDDDYVETTVGSAFTNSTSKGSTTGSTSATPSSHMDTQSPLSPFDNYIPMSPGTPLSSGEPARAGVEKSKTPSTSVPHSRTSSNIIDEQDGYVPMAPGNFQHGRSGSEVCSTAGSTTGALDEAYFDMDLSRRLNLSSDEFPRMSPASSESLQSSTPSSDFPLEKVSSYLLSTDELDDNLGRPMRAYSVGSRSDTTGVGKGRFGKNRLEAVQETFRMRALSVGAKMQKPNTIPNTTKTTPENHKRGDRSSDKSLSAVTSIGLTPLSNSWSGTTGKWPAHKFLSPATMEPTQASSKVQSQEKNVDSVDSDLMELDFSHNKKNRKRSLPGPNNLPSLSGSGVGPSSSMGSTGSGGQKLSPGLLKSGCETPETPSESQRPPQFLHQQSPSSLPPCSKYPSSAPISIQKTKCNTVDSGDYMDTSAGGSILSRITGLGTKEIKQLDKEGAYMDMSFGKPPIITNSSLSTETANATSSTNLKLNPMVIVKPSENVPPSVFTLNPTTTVTTCVSSSPKLAFFGVSPSAMAAPLSYFGSCSQSGPTQVNTTQTVSPSSSLNLLHPPLHSSTSSSATGSTSPSLTRIEESPEKHEASRQTSHDEDDNCKGITYAAIDHSALESISPHKRPAAVISPLRSSTCNNLKAPEASSRVTYSQVEFIKSSDAVKRN